MFIHNIRIADEIICIKYNFEETSTCLHSFYCQDSADVCVVIDEARLISEANYLNQKFPTSRFLDFQVEYNAIYRDVTKILIKRGVFLVHGVLLKINNAGVLFMAPSGIGKSTHAQLWIQKYGNIATIINGDKPLLKMKEGSLIAYGSPWKGKERIGNNESVKLQKVCIVKRDELNSICRMVWDAQSFTFFLSECLMSDIKDSISAYIECYKQISSFTDLYELHCNTTEEAAVIAYEEMFNRNY